MRRAELLSIAALAACVPVDGEGDDGGPRAGYPAGPYGTAHGAVIADLSFTRTDGSALTFGDIFRDGHNRLLLVSTAAGWCTACIEEQPALEELHAAWQPRGLYVLLSVFEDADYLAADAAYAETWRARFDVTFTVVADTPFVLADYYDETMTPLTLLVDVPKMEILRSTTGFDRSAVEAIVEAKLP